jgi:antitoxin (DNA-binding transcriptional repressor) of toxin-antitoxin stability system
VYHDHREKQEFAARLGELFALVEGGAEVVVRDANVPPVKLVPVTLQARPRVLGLHPGSMSTTDDFDAPLGEEFWGDDVP